MGARRHRHGRPPCAPSGSATTGPRGRRSFTTIDCSANFLSSAEEGEQVTATAAPLHLGRTTQVWDATVTNETTGERLMASYRRTQIILY